METVTRLRDFSTLTEEQRHRFRRYIQTNADIPSKELAEDLWLIPATVASIKANLYRHLR